MIIGIKDNKEYSIPVKEENMGEYTLITVKKEDYNGYELVKILPDIAECSACEGYYVVPDQLSGMTVELNETQKDYNADCWHSVCFYGVKTQEKCFAVILEGMKYEAVFRYYRQNNVNNAYFVLRLQEENIEAYEDITALVYKLPNDATYSDMAKIYRDYKYKNGLKTIIEKNLPKVLYASEAPEIRVRMGWKPVPASIEYQTKENEPEMHVAVTFDMLIRLMEKMHTAGIEKAEICLVGWNKSGHDGRWPDIFPVEERLGGEEGLKKAIKRAKELGYQIVAHTNSSDAYTIADSFDENSMVRNHDYTVAKGTTWSGGRMHKLCAKEAVKIIKNELPKVRELGFEGVHYIDVLSVVRPYYCYHKEHPCNRKETALLWKEMLQYARTLFGGCASEGTYDIVSEGIDFGLYAGFSKFTKPRYDFKHTIIPLWELVYHGAVMACPSSDLVNVGILDKKLQLKLIEFGGRPAMYIHSRFVTESKDRGNWMGEDDLYLNDEAQLERTVNALKSTAEFYEPVKHLQTVRMIDHTYLTPDLVRVTYENGERVYVNYSENDITVENVTVKGTGYTVNK